MERPDVGHMSFPFKPASGAHMPVVRPASHIKIYCRIYVWYSMVLTYVHNGITTL
jgi:hypothetical protein